MLRKGRCCWLNIWSLVIRVRHRKPRLSCVARRWAGFVCRTIRKPADKADDSYNDDDQYRFYDGEAGLIRFFYNITSLLVKLNIG